MIRIISRKEGFYRCGVKHSAIPTDYADDRFTPEQLDRLKAEPMLIVVNIPDPPPAIESVSEGDVAAAEGEGKKKSR